MTYHVLQRLLLVANKDLHLLCVCLRQPQLAAADVAACNSSTSDLPGQPITRAVHLTLALLQPSCTARMHICMPEPYNKKAPEAKLGEETSQPTYMSQNKSVRKKL
jgi:hypothetical protein